MRSRISRSIGILDTLPLQLSGPTEIKSADQRILATSNEAGAGKK